jgi:hypothetical protein
MGLAEMAWKLAWRRTGGKEWEYWATLTFTWPKRRYRFLTSVEREYYRIIDFIWKCQKDMNALSQLSPTDVVITP